MGSHDSPHYDVGLKGKTMKFEPEQASESGARHNAKPPRLIGISQKDIHQTLKASSSRKYHLFALISHISPGQHKACRKCAVPNGNRFEKLMDHSTKPFGQVKRFRSRKHCCIPFAFYKLWYISCSRQLFWEPLFIDFKTIVMKIDMGIKELLAYEFLMHCLLPRLLLNAKTRIVEQNWCWFWT